MLRTVWAALVLGVFFVGCRAWAVPPVPAATLAAGLEAECWSQAASGQAQALSVSAYSSEETSEEDGSQRLTAAGNLPRRGVAAISRDLYALGWAFGRKVCVRGWGVFVIDDLMGPGRTQGLDLFMDSREEALRFGRRTLGVLLLEGL